MMSTQHLFLSSPVAHVPDRLHEAFADIQALDAAAMLVRLAGQPAASCLVWLSNADPQWLAALQYVLQAQADARVVLLSSVPESTEGLSALNAGARGYTHAYGVPALLQEVALVIEHGGLWVGPDLLQRLVGSTSAALAARPAANPASVPANSSPTSNAWSVLSAREAEVARSVLAGCSNKEVATKMFISERTVKAHMGAVFEKLGVRDRLQLVLRLSASGDPKLSPVKETAT